MRPQEVAVVLEQFLQTGPGHIGQLISVSLDVPEAWLPSRCSASRCARLAPSGLGAVRVFPGSARRTTPCVIDDLAF